MLIFIQIRDSRLKLHLNKGFWSLNQIAGGESGRGCFLQCIGCIMIPVALEGSLSPLVTSLGLSGFSPGDNCFYKEKVFK